ncbi:MAG: xanthine dehydrogenase family protein molybdopterin-binding subunit [Planctomycetes bacterium]|nr:xanthine dehydrogenase family protein molybdopterin-binding subunit [Planctomycetota bacterium]
MSRDPQTITIKVGFGDQVRELVVTIGEGDIPPYQVGDRHDEVGQRRNRVDAVAKVTGRARYTYDRKGAGMLYGKMLRSPHANANIRSVDLSKALTMPGVKAALDFVEVFKDRSARYAGCSVAAVAAETEAQAEAALDAIVVDYQVLPFAVTTEAAMAEAAPQTGRGDDRNVSARGLRDGESAADFLARIADQDQAVQEAMKGQTVVSGRFSTSVQTHSALETHGVVCDWDGDNLLCYCSTQGTFGVRRDATASPQLRARNARVVAEYVGGGFGAKFGLGREGVAGALLAKRAGRPVRLMLDRREEHVDGGNRPDSFHDLSMAVGRDGKIVALKARNWGTPGNGSGGAGARNQAYYAIPLVDKVELNVRTNAGGARAFRAPGYPQGIFALESLMDMAADAIGLDPLEFRRRNDPHPIRIHEYDLGAERAQWQKRRNRNPGAGSDPIKRGMGMAATEWFNPGGGGASCLVRIMRDGTVEVRNGAQDIGTGTRTVMGMVVAEELGLRIDQVETFIGDTRDPQGPGSGGSTTIGSLTPAARLAGYRAAEQLLGLVAGQTGWKAEDLRLRGGMVVRKDGGRLPREMSFAQACALIADEAIEVTEKHPMVGSGRNASANYEGFADTNSGLQFAEVEVDTETGKVRVLRVVAVQDSGKYLNPKTAESQIRGGVIQGVSYALFERRIMDRHQGHMLNADLENYRVVGALETPEIDVVLVDVANGKNNTSVMGLGEPPTIATAAAIANAVANAIGARVTSLPITPRKVLEALAAKGRKR